MVAITLDAVLVHTPGRRAEVPDLGEGVLLQDVSTTMMLRQLAAGRGSRNERGVSLDTLVRIQEHTNGDYI